MARPSLSHLPYTRTWHTLTHRNTHTHAHKSTHLSFRIMRTTLAAPSCAPHRVGHFSLFFNIILILTLGILFLSVTGAHAVNTLYEYALFKSDPDTSDPVDGANLTGVFCRPALSGVVIGNSVIFSDMCGTGSAIRSVNSLGVHVLAGSLMEMGYADGLPLDALFSGYTAGTTQVNGLAYADGSIYMADSVNSVIRKFDINGNVTTFVPTSARVNNLSLNFPLSVAPYIRKDNSKMLFISDTANKRIISTPLDDNVPLLTQLVSGFQPGMLAVSQSLRVLFYIHNSFSFGATQLEGGQDSWIIGNTSCINFVSSFVLFNGDSEILFFGGAGTEQGIYTIPTSASKEDAPSLCPTLKYRWNSSETISMLVTRDSTSLYVITKSNVYILSETTVPWPPSDAIAAFPMNALPTSDLCLMSQAYYWIRYDAAIALNTTDYYSLFVDAKGNIVTYEGNVNVSDMCGSISAQLSSDKTVAIFDFVLTAEIGNTSQIQTELDNSPWHYTKLFLEDLKKRHVPVQPFCFFNCTVDCISWSTTNHTCPISKWHCDGLCKGAIATTATLGTIGAALIVIAIISPAAFFTASILIPVI